MRQFHYDAAGAARMFTGYGIGRNYGEPLSPWEKTPRWMFWKPAFRRRTWAHYHDLTFYYVSTGFEYQSVEFVARDALEKEFGPSTSTDGRSGEGVNSPDAVPGT